MFLNELNPGYNEGRVVHVNFYKVMVIYPPARAAIIQTYEKLFVVQEYIYA